MTFAEYQKFSRSVHARAERVRNMILEDARRTCKAAGLSPQYLGIHPHNAMISYREGKPWPGVDYKLVRRTMWLCERSFEPSRLANRIISRAWDRVSREVYGYKG
jgi:hypothetical protein